MQIPFIKFKSPILAVILLAALLLGSVFWGIRQGRANANAQSVYQDSQEIVKGLDYFFNDQNRFPTPQEFLDTKILFTYFSRLPNNTPDNSFCSENFIYKRLDADSYELNFCLAADLGPYRKGWNQLRGSGK